MIISRFHELPRNFFSLRTAQLVREDLRKHQYKMVEDETYEYGYYSAQTAIVFSINSIFGSYNPMIGVAAVTFFFYRTLAESTVFLSVHDKEMDGNGLFISALVQKCFYGMMLGHLLAMLRAMAYGEH